MKIYNTISENQSLYIFTNNPEKDIDYFIEKYENDDSKIHLWYEPPRLDKYEFLWNEYTCIHLWYDNEEDMQDDAKIYFDSKRNKLLNCQCEVQ